MVRQGEPGRRRRRRRKKWDSEDKHQRNDIKHGEGRGRGRASEKERGHERQKERGHERENEGSRDLRRLYYKYKQGRRKPARRGEVGRKEDKRGKHANMLR